MKPFEPINNVIIDNILTEQEIELIYKDIELLDDKNTFISKIQGFKAYYPNFNPLILNKIEKIVQNNFGNHWKIKAVMFARYSNEWGWKPQLSPHFDTAFQEHKLTFDVQLKGNIPWNIFVENKSFLLKNNQALMFSGTDQIHWREKITLKNNEFLDLLFCHFDMEDSENWKITEEWKNKMHKKQKIWENKLKHFMKGEKIKND
jgi:hypothetical protein